MELSELLRELEVSENASALLVSLLWDVVLLVGGAVVVGVGAFFAVAVFLWNRLDRKFDGLSSRIDRLETDLRSDIGRLANRIDDLSNKILMVAMNKPVTSSDPGDEGGAVETRSPLVLSEKGLRIANAINAKALAEKYADKVLLDENPDELDIQLASFMFARGMLMLVVDQKEREMIKKVTYEEGGDANAVYTTVGVLLRDYHLEKRGFEVPVRRAKGEQTSPQQTPQPQNHPHP